MAGAAEPAGRRDTRELGARSAGGARSAAVRTRASEFGARSASGAVRLAKLDEAGLATIASLDITVEKLATLEPEALAKLSRLDPAGLGKLASLEETALTKFTTLDQKALSKFATLDEAALQKFAKLDDGDEGSAARLSSLDAVCITDVDGPLLFAAPIEVGSHHCPQHLPSPDPGFAASARSRNTAFGGAVTTARAVGCRWSHGPVVATAVCRARPQVRSGLVVAFPQHPPDGRGTRTTVCQRSGWVQAGYSRFDLAHRLLLSGQCLAAPSCCSL